MSATASAPAAPPRTLLDRILAEGPLSIVEAAAANGCKLHQKSALRQAIHGSGKAKLESIKLNGKRVTSAAAYRRFLEAQQRRPEQPAVLGADDVDRSLSAFGLGRGSKRGKRGGRR